MNRYGTSGKQDTPPLLQREAGWLGVNSKISPENLPAGMVSEAINKRFRSLSCDTRDGMAAPEFARVGSVIFGSGIFSDPNDTAGNEWLLLATAAAVWRCADGFSPVAIALPAPLTGTVDLVQAFDKVLLFRGADLTPWVWDGMTGHAFEEIISSSVDILATIPNSVTGELFGNRLYVPHSRDSVAISEILDYTAYDPIYADFRINAGSDDAIVRLFPFTSNGMLVFKEQSIYLLANLLGDLSKVTLQIINGQLGCVARRSVAMVGADVFFLSDTGVYRVLQVVQERLQTGEIAVSDAIEPFFRHRINWAAAAGACACVHREYYYLAVPIDGSLVNNAVLIYNTVTAQWEGHHTFAGGTVGMASLIRSDWNGEKRLFAVPPASQNWLRAFLLYEGEEDLTAQLPGAILPVADSITTRANLLGAGGRKNFTRLEITLLTWNPSFSVSLIGEGVSVSQTLCTARQKSRTRNVLYGKPAFVETNVNDDFRSRGREDYSVNLATLDTELDVNAGIPLDQLQSSTERFPARLQSRFCQVKISNAQGRCQLQTVSLAGYETERHLRTEN